MAENFIPSGHGQIISPPLFYELKKIFPIVPDWVLTDIMQKCHNNREQCIHMLYNANAYACPPPPYPGYVINGTGEKLRSMSVSATSSNPMGAQPDSPPPFSAPVVSTAFTPFSGSVSLQYHNAGNKTSFTIRPNVPTGLQHPTPNFSKPPELLPPDLQQQLRMHVSYYNQQVRRIPANPAGLSMPYNNPADAPMGVLVTRPMENGPPPPVISSPVRHKTSLNITPISPPNFDQYAYGAGHAQDCPVVSCSSHSTHHSSSINVHVEPPPYPPHPQIHITVGSRGKQGNGKGKVIMSPSGVTAIRTELRPAPPPPPVTPLSAVTTPTSSSGYSSFGASSIRRPPPRPPPPVIRRPPQSAPQFDLNDPEQEKVSQKPIRPTRPNILELIPPVRDDEAYIQALVLLQQERLEHFSLELKKEKHRLHVLQEEVTGLEYELFQRRRRSRSHSFTSLDELQQLREDNRRLRVECDYMANEVDFLHKGQVPLGETSEEFYESINTGQAGLVLPGPSSDHDDSRDHMQSHEHSHLNSPERFPHNIERHEDEEDDESNKWSCSRCTFRNNAALDVCEICGMLRFGRVATEQ